MGKAREIAAISQVYPPDPAAVGQHMADVAEALAAQGHRVTVFTSDRGYDNPSQRFAAREIRNGVRIIRLRLTSFGKMSMTARLLGGASLLVQASGGVLTSRRPQALLLTTSPPIAGLAGGVLSFIRRIPFDYWLMDLNPDQAVELGQAKAGSVQVRLFDALNRMVLRRARHVIALDDAMADRFHQKLPSARRPVVVPVWSPGEFEPPQPEASAPLRARYGLSGKRVVMYGGNHSIAHPLEDLVDAARRRDASSGLRFVFMGGGLAKVPIDAWVKAEAPGHVVSLPYQPLKELASHLAMSDVQVVVVGPKTVGIVHPSKLYGALGAGRAILVIGPEESPAAKLVREHQLGWVVEHGDKEGLEQALMEIEHAPQETIDAMGRRGHHLATTEFSRKKLIARVVDIVLGLDPGRDGA